MNKSALSGTTNEFHRVWVTLVGFNRSQLWSPKWLILVTADVCGTRDH